MQFNKLRYAITFGIILALIVVMLGAYTRLTDAGLGCPDWPGCYGHMILSKANLVSFDHLLSVKETHKAWTEMVHRYAAGTLALLIFFILGSVLYYRKQNNSLPITLPLLLMLLVIFQATLGMWTVTLKLLPIVVTAHLLGGILLFSCLSSLRLQLSSIKPYYLPQWRFWIILGALIVFGQIILGGWVSSNYAGIACIGFPQCNGEWLPKLDFSQVFDGSKLGPNYQGGLLNNASRLTIQYIHRLGAVLTLTYLLILSFLLLIKISYKPIQYVARVIIFFVLIQFVLGIINVVYLLPLWSSVAHNGMAALLMASMFMLIYLTKKWSANDV